jgi:hypothetical protein
MAPVRIGAKAPPVLEELAAMEVARTAPPPIAEVIVGTPEVKGTAETDEAPAKATAVVVGFGVRVVALGLRTLVRC